MSRGERYNVILHEMGNDSGVWHTTHTIAKLIAMKPSTHLRNILNEMVDNGLLHRQYEWSADPLLRGSRPIKVWYCLPHRDTRLEMFG